MDWYIRCEVCGADLFDPNHARCYQIKAQKISFIECRLQPWTGVRAICNECIRAIAEQEPKTYDNPPMVADFQNWTSDHLGLSDYEIGSEQVDEYADINGIPSENARKVLVQFMR